MKTVHILFEEKDCGRFVEYVDATCGKNKKELDVLTGMVIMHDYNYRFCEEDACDMLSGPISVTKIDSETITVFRTDVYKVSGERYEFLLGYYYVLDKMEEVKV